MIATTRCPQNKSKQIPAHLETTRPPMERVSDDSLSKMPHLSREVCCKYT
jgi:hypothetical protein